MMRTVIFAVVVLLAGGTFWSVQAPLLRAQPERVPPTDVASLTRQLGSPAFRERQRAMEALAQVGPPCRRRLEVLERSLDPEVRLRARALLQRCRAAELWLPSRVSYAASNRAASEAIRAISTQTGNHLLLGDAFGSFREIPLTVQFDDVPFWEALDAVCQKSGNVVRPSHIRSSALVVVAGSRGNCPTAYAGPLRALVSAAARGFSEEADLAFGHSRVNHTLALTLKILWEERFHLVAYQPRLDVLEARTDTGQELFAAAETRDKWMVLLNQQPELHFRLGLQPPDGAAKCLAVLRLGLDLIAVGGLETLVVDDLSYREPHYRDTLACTVLGVRQTKAQWEITVCLAEEGAVVPDPPEILFRQYAFRALDARGESLALQDRSDVLADNGVQTTLTFSGGDRAGDPKTLQVSFPKVRSRRVLEFTFRDVPLPTARF